MSEGRAYYNEIDPYAAQWLRNLIAGGHIAPGDVDERSIVDVRPSDLEGYAQCHFFAGIGGWSYAARLAGWPDDKPLWTGSCPCQPFSVSGKQEGQADERHLWPVLFDLIRACKPPVVMGEQVAAAVGKDWLDGVHSDLEGIGYACGASVVPACAVNAPHRRDRLWFVADRDSTAVRDEPGGIGWKGWTGQRVDRHDREIHVADPAASNDGVCFTGALSGCEPESGSRDESCSLAQPEHGRREGRHSFWRGAGPALPPGEGSWLSGADGKARRVEPGIRLLAHGVPARVGKLRAYGNAIVPQVAAEVIGAFLDVERSAA
ncbi:DNA cytosine methyltransferase [Bosea sp. ASV33]|uniref:DNA cytosine methyltransferase n=1 Tax=Bosea sp. ASV33 TaxID=2795106 RepID=UPI0018EE1E14|nr:DNA cytosine methyltransferase [Bosea sp. ASV33]